jgi:biopolymer transport protein ExbB
MENISEALVATAIGLVVAIPAVAAFNAFQRVVKARVANTAALGHVLMAHLRAVEAPELQLSSGANAAGKAKKASDKAGAASTSAGD